MSNFKKFLPFLFGAAVLLASQAHAITPFLSSQVGLSPASGTFLETNGVTSTWATVSGGSGNPAGSNGQVQYNSNGSFGATSTFTVSSTSGLVTLQLLNGFAYASDFPGADDGAKINAAYLALPSNGGTVYAMCTQGAENYATPIVFGTDNKPAVLIGCGGTGFYASGGTTLEYTGSSGAAFTYNVAQYSSAGIGLKNISFVGNVGVGVIGPQTAPSNTTSTVGLALGGTNGATGFTMDGVQVSGFGRGVVLGNNIFLLNITNSVINKNGINIQNLTASGAVGENNRITDSVLADSNSTGGSISDFCVYIQLSGNNQWVFTNNSFDDCQFYSTQFGGTANINKFVGNHFEDPNTGQGAYYFIDGQGNQNTVGGLVTQSIGNDYMQDFTSGALPSFIHNGADFISTGDTVEVNNNVNNAMQAFVTNQDGNDIVSWSGLAQKFGNTSAPAAITNVVLNTSAPFSETGLVYGTSTPIFYVTTSTATFKSISSIQPTSPSSIYTLLAGNVVFGALGMPTRYTTTTTLTANNFCQVLNYTVMDSTSTVTSTINLPTLASIQASTPQMGGCGPLVQGAKEIQETYNSSTANLIINASSGIIFKLAVGNSVSGNTSSSIIIPPGDILEQDGTAINTSTFFIQNTLYQ